jgi:hypothetical protein
LQEWSRQISIIDSTALVDMNVAVIVDAGRGG